MLLLTVARLKWIRAPEMCPILEIYARAAGHPNKETHKQIRVEKEQTGDTEPKREAHIANRKHKPTSSLQLSFENKINCERYLTGRGSCQGLAISLLMLCCMSELLDYFIVHTS